MLESTIQKYFKKIRRLYKLLKNEDVIDKYTISDLSHSKELHLGDKLSEKEINNFIFIESNTTIIFNKFEDIHDEKTYLNNLAKIFKILNKHNKRYTIKINISNRRLLKESKLLNYTNNINLIIHNSNYDYTINEYIEEEKRLDELIKPIKEANLSPFEKYLAVYNKVKQFKAYKESKENKKEARTIKYILDNEYIVCVGFSELLTILLHKVEIPTMTIVIGIDESYKKGFTMECIPTKIVGHQRNIIKIDDDKYNIHGIYIADPTWDNNMQKDLYHNAAITFDRKKEAKDLERLTTALDILLDFHNIEEFNEKINYILKRETRKLTNKKYSKKLISAYKTIYIKIMEILVKLDYQKYRELYLKYHHIISEKTIAFKKQKDISLKELEKIYINFLTEYFYYIINLTNKKIDEDILYQSLRIVKKTINGYNDEKLNIWEQTTKLDNNQTEHEYFPHLYNPNEPRLNYLSDAPSKKKVRVQNSAKQ